MLAVELGQQGGDAGVVALVRELAETGGSGRRPGRPADLTYASPPIGPIIGRSRPDATKGFGPPERTEPLALNAMEPVGVTQLVTAAESCASESSNAASGTSGKEIFFKSSLSVTADQS